MLVVQYSIVQKWSQATTGPGDAGVLRVCLSHAETYADGSVRQLMYRGMKAACPVLPQALWTLAVPSRAEVSTCMPLLPAG
jgi:hypothetical protein